MNVSNSTTNCMMCEAYQDNEVSKSCNDHADLNEALDDHRAYQEYQEGCIQESHNSYESNYIPSHY